MDHVKQCPDNADCTKVNLEECIKDYLKAITGFPNLGNQLIFLLCAAKKPALMPMYKFMRCGVQLLSYSFSAISRVATSVE
jgi:hypothetical protein